MFRHFLVGVTCLLFSVGSASAQDTSYWGTYQGNASHTGYVPGAFDPTTLHVAWQAQFPPSPGNDTTWIGSVSEGDGRVFLIGNQAGGWWGPNLYALNASTGQQQWQQPLGDPSQVAWPAYANGTVYAQLGVAAR